MLKWAATVAIAGSAFFAAPAQALNVTLSSGCSGPGTYAYSNVAIDASGTVTVTCTSTTPSTGPGTVGFSPTTYSVNVGQQVALNITRTNGTVGQVGANMNVISGNCTLASGSVSFLGGDAAPKTVMLNGNGVGPCSVGMAITGGAIAGATTASVSVTNPNDPGTFVLAQPASGPVAGGPAVNIVVQRPGGTSGGYTVPFTAVMTGLTGATLDASPVTFAAGEGSKNLTFNPGTTPGTLQITLGQPAPILPNTTPTTASTAVFTVTVLAAGDCPATLPTGVVMLQNIPQAEGSWFLANLDSGIIGSTRLPNLPAGVVGATITQTSTEGTGPIKTIELSISKCPGDMTYYTQQTNVVNGRAYQPCYNKTDFVTNSSVKWHLEVSGHYAFCYAPVSQGPWYLNVRYAIPDGCRYGQGACGSSIQWNR